MPIQPPQILQQYLQQAWGELDPVGAAEFLHPAYRRHVSPHFDPIDRRGQVQRIAAFLAAFGDITFTLHDVVGQGDRFAFRSSLQGVHAGPFAGIEPSGRRVVVSSLEIMRIQDGLIAEHWGGPDLHDLMWQLTGGDAG